MITVSDFFCGGGGSSTGMIQVPNVQVKIAANHWQTALDIHNANHQDTDHAHVDLHLERPSYFPTTVAAWFSPECKKWSQANGANLPAIEEGLFEDPLSDDVKQRSRLLMFDVLKYIEYHRYRLVVVENVVDIATQAKYATAWRVWRDELRALGYRWRVVSLNSMHAQLLGAPAPQSRDRIYIVAWPEKEKAPDLDRVVRPRAYCPRCDVVAEAVQSWNPRREVGRYKQAYTYNCRTCNRPVEPGWIPAAAAIDWTLPGQRIGDRSKPLADKTLERIAAGIARYWGPMVLEAGGNVYDATDPKHRNHGNPDAYYRAWPIDEALRTLHTTNSKALAVPVEGRDGKDALPIDVPMRTQTTRNETALAFIAEFYGTATARAVSEPVSTLTAGGNHHGLVTRHYGVAGGEPARHTTSSDEYLRTLTANGGNMSLIHRMNAEGAGMTTPLWEELRTITAAGTQALLSQPEKRRVTPADIAEAREMLPEVYFRMFEPHEVAAGMAFPSDYEWQPPDRSKPVSKRDLVTAAGNAVTPPSARDVFGVAVEGIAA